MLEKVQVSNWKLQDQRQSKIIQTGGLGHYEIVPVNPMTLAQYQELLNHIENTIIR